MIKTLNSGTSPMITVFKSHHGFSVEAGVNGVCLVWKKRVPLPIISSDVARHLAKYLTMGAQEADKYARADASLSRTHKE
jgi:hypothetical protein